MTLHNEKVKDLVQEGIKLSFDIIEGIYSEKRRKMVLLFVLIAVVLLSLAVLLCATGHLNLAISLGAGGITGLVFLFFYDMKTLKNLKKELDTLYYYINY